LEVFGFYFGTLERQIGVFTLERWNYSTRGEVATSLVGVIKDYEPGGPYYNPNDAKTIAAYNQFTNRVDVSNYMAETVRDTPDDWATSVTKRHPLYGIDSTKERHPLYDSLFSCLHDSAHHTSFHINPHYPSSAKNAAPFRGE
jgi:hypothetical protein